MNLNDHLPTFEQLIRIAPISFIVIMIVSSGFFGAWWLMRRHIESLSDMIEYLKSLIP